MAQYKNANNSTSHSHCTCACNRNRFKSNHWLELRTKPKTASLRNAYQITSSVPRKSKPTVLDVLWNVTWPSTQCSSPLHITPWCDNTPWHHIQSHGITSVMWHYSPLEAAGLQFYSLYVTDCKGYIGQSQAIESVRGQWDPPPCFFLFSVPWDYANFCQIVFGIESSLLRHHYLTSLMSVSLLYLSDSLFDDPSVGDPATRRRTVDTEWVAGPRGATWWSPVTYTHEH